MCYKHATTVCMLTGSTLIFYLVNIQVLLVPVYSIYKWTPQSAPWAVFNGCVLLDIFYFRVQVIEMGCQGVHKWKKVRSHCSTQLLFLHHLRVAQNTNSSELLQILFVHFSIPGEKGLYIIDVSLQGPAAKAGVKPNDRLIEINGENVENDTHEEVVEKVPVNYLSFFFLTHWWDLFHRWMFWGYT